METYKSYETKPADIIQGRSEEDYLSKLTSAITTIRGVNKTDVLMLGATFKTASGIMKASMHQLAACPGIGPTKVKRLYETFHQPFRRAPDARRAFTQGQLMFPASQDAGNAASQTNGRGQDAMQDAVEKVVSGGVGGIVSSQTANAVAASVQPLLEDRVLQTPLDQLDDDDPDADFELDV